MSAAELILAGALIAAAAGVALLDYRRRHR